MPQIAARPADLVADLTQALTTASAALAANDIERLMEAVSRQQGLLAELAPHADTLRQDAAVAPRLLAAAHLNAEVAILLAARQGQIRARLETLGVRPAAATYGGAARSGGRRLGSA